MSVACYPITVLPHVSRLYADFLAQDDNHGAGPLSTWYAGSPAYRFALEAAPAGGRQITAVADLLQQQSLAWGAGQQTLDNIEKLRRCARAIVTGQQVGLFGGPLLTLLKAATAIARARQATRESGIDHVPVFWLATEDHDLAEVDQVSIPGRTALETLHLKLPATGREVGAAVLGEGVEALLDHVAELLAYAPIVDRLRECYQPGQTLGSAFGRLMTQLFQQHGLIVMDAAAADLHRLGASTLRAAIEQAEPLERALLERTAQLEAAGYHAQVLVNPGASLLFLIHAENGRRMPLRRQPGGTWKAGADVYTTADLLAILDAEPARLSPNALLRPIFQDTLLPTAAYIGGPAEIAYFAQSALLYERILGRITPVLPRFSATLLEPAFATIMDNAELTLPDLFEAGNAAALAQKLGARAMPIEGKRQLAATGNAMNRELTALTDYLARIDASLGRSALVSASKMRYQMNRLRRMAATFEVQKEASLLKHATALMLNLYPDAHPQERLISGITLLAHCGESLIDRLVEAAADRCPGHSVLRV